MTADELAQFIREQKDAGFLKPPHEPLVKLLDGSYARIQQVHLARAEQWHYCIASVLDTGERRRVPMSRLARMCYVQTDAGLELALREGSFARPEVAA